MAVLQKCLEDNFLYSRYRGEKHKQLRRTGAAEPNEKTVEMSMRRRGNQRGERGFVLIFSKQCSDSPLLPRQTHRQFPIQSQKLDQDWFSLEDFLFPARRL